MQVFWGLGNGTWLGFASSLGALSAGGMLTFWASYRDTTPGIKHDGVWFSSLLARGALGWVAGILMTGLYVVLYWFPEYLGYQRAVWADGAQVEAARVTGGLVQVVEPLAQWMVGGPSSQWFLYGVLYCLAMLTFGVRMIMKYRHNRYQLIRTGSVLFFQIDLRLGPAQHPDPVPEAVLRAQRPVAAEVRLPVAGQGRPSCGTRRARSGSSCCSGAS